MAGPSSRVPELSLSEITQAGITTAVGVLGTDNVTRSLKSLLAKAKALNEWITSFIYTGSYHLPSVTIAGDVRTDIALIEEIIGVKLAISDHRCSQPTTDELKKTAAQAHVGGMLGNKPGIVHLHVGSGSQGLKPIEDVVESSEIPITQFLPTHLGGTSDLLKQGIEFVEQGGYMDITCPSKSLNWDEGIESTMKTITESGIPLSNVTFSSDGNGSMPKFDKKGNLTGLAKGEVRALHQTITALVESKVLPLSDALSLITSNPAKRLGIYDRKGNIEEGKDADLLILSKDLEIEKVFAQGKLLVKEGKPVVKGAFE